MKNYIVGNDINMLAFIFNHCIIVLIVDIFFE